MAGSFAKEPRRLRFDSHDDALNFANKSVEDSRRLLARNKLTLRERYLKGSLELVLEFRLSGEPRDYVFVFRAIPLHNDGAGTALDNHFFGIDVGNVKGDAKDDLMLVNAGQLTESVQSIIPSQVGLKCFYERPNLARDGWAAFLLGNWREFRFKANKWKVKTIKVVSAKTGRSSANRLIEGVPEIIDSVRKDRAKAAGYLLCEYPFVDYLAALRVNLLDWGASATSEKGFASRIKIGKVFFSPLDKQFWPLKGVKFGVTHER